MVKKVFCTFFLFTTLSFAQLRLVSWNVENLGSSKSDETITFIAHTLKNYDVVALQEIVAGNGGAQAVAQLADALNRKGSKWDYVISDPTSSSAYKTERYAFLWKTARVKKIGDAWLEKKYSIEMDREPFYCTFEFQSKAVTLVNFHAITQRMQPETEIKYFKLLPSQYPDLNLVFVGDFNCPQSHTVFIPLQKMGYKSAFQKQKTSLKKECKKGECLASEFDNIWYDSATMKCMNAKAILFYQSFASLQEARAISDHIPIAVELFFK